MIINQWFPNPIWKDSVKNKPTIYSYTKHTTRESLLIKQRTRYRTPHYSDSSCKGRMLHINLLAKLIKVIHYNYWFLLTQQTLHPRTFLLFENQKVLIFFLNITKHREQDKKSNVNQVWYTVISFTNFYSLKSQRRQLRI